MASGFQVSGQKDVQAAFQKLIKAVDAKELSMAGAEVVFDLSQELVPVDTGELKDSGEFVQVGDDAEVRYGTDHALPVEFGTSKMAAQPFLRPALDKHSDIIQEVAKKLKSQVGE